MTCARSMDGRLGKPFKKAYVQSTKKEFSSIIFDLLAKLRNLDCISEKSYVEFFNQLTGSVRVLGDVIIINEVSKYKGCMVEVGYDFILKSFSISVYEKNKFAKLKSASMAYLTRNLFSLSIVDGSVCGAKITTLSHKNPIYNRYSRVLAKHDRTCSERFDTSPASVMDLFDILMRPVINSELDLSSGELLQMISKSKNQSRKLKTFLTTLGLYD